MDSGTVEVPKKSFAHAEDCIYQNLWKYIEKNKRHWFLVWLYG